MKKSVLISGAGIAGLTLAYWLKQYGFTPTIVEKHPCLRTGGYKIDIRGVALEIIQRMGIASKVAERQTVITRSIIVNSEGKTVSEITGDLCGIRQQGVDLEILRGTLCLLMQEAVGEVEYLYGDSIVQMEEISDAVEVSFQKNAPRCFDLVIGADGLHSQVRKLVFGEMSQFAHEYGVYVSVFSIPNFLDLDGSEVEYHTKQRFVNVYRDKNSLVTQVAIAFFGEPFSSRDPIEQKKRLEEAFADGGWEMPRILKEMHASPDFYFDKMAQIRMPAWSKGRVALVGDAAYSPTPMSGQGTSIAIAGAYVLAGELAQSQGDYRAAFTNYETSLRSFIEKNQALAQMGAQIMQGVTGEWVYKIAALIPGMVINFIKRLGLRRTTKAANALTLKNYCGRRMSAITGK